MIVDAEPVKEAKILWSPTSGVAPGSTLEVPFEVPLGTDDDAWIGVIPADVPHGDEKKADEADLTYEKLGERSRGTVRLKAPDAPGSYTVRMFSDDDKGVELGSVTFSVGPAPSSDS